MFRIVIFFFVVLSTVSCWAADALAEDCPPTSVLYLSSYHENMTWVRDIEQAITDVLKPSESNTVIHIEQMDTKRHPSLSYRQYLFQFYKEKYQNSCFDLIMVSDNNAYDFMREHRDQLFPGTPVVFCGVNDFDKKQIRHLKGFTGIAETFDARATLEVALKNHPATKNVFVVNDHLSTGKAWKKTIENQLSPFRVNLNLSYSKEGSLAELTEQISTLPANTIVLLGVYFSDKQGSYVTYEQIGQVLALKSKMPVYCLLEFNISKGVIGGNVIGGYFQGEAMAKIAKRILQGESPEDIPVVSQGGTRYVFDEKVLRSFGIGSSTLPTGSILVNPVPSLFRVSKATLLVFAGVLLLVAVFTLMLRVELAKRKQSEARFGAIFDSISDAIIFTDYERRIVMTNPAFTELLGYEQSEVMGKTSESLYANDGDYEFHGAERFNKESTIIQSTYETQYRRKDGGVADVEVLGSHVLNDADALIGFLAVIRNISDRKQAEMALIVATKKAENANQAKTQFLANMSHELRTPLNGMLGMLQILQGGPLNSEQMENISIALSSGKGLLTLLNDLLDLSKIEAGKISFVIKPCSLSGLIKEITQIFNTVLSGKKLKFDVELDKNFPAFIDIDRQRVLQIMFNLIGNSVKFTQEGTVTLTVEMKQFENEGFVEFVVSDTGIGIPAHSLESIYEPFSQVEGTYQKEFQGAGLGLSIVKKLVESMGGKIQIESKVNVGTRVWVKVPATVSTQDKQLPESCKNVGLCVNPLWRILIVEDNLVNLIVVEKMLSKLGISAQTANNGREALDILAKDEFDLVLMDIQMPIMDGVDATIHIRAGDYGVTNPNIPIVALTAFVQKVESEQFIESGMNSTLAKPISVKALEQAICDVLNPEKLG